MTYIQPLLTAFLLIAAAGLIQVRRRRGSGLLTVGLFGLFLISWPPMDWLLARHLERHYPVRPFAGATAGAIVVLASGVTPPHYEIPFYLADKDTYERCELAAWLHKHWQPAPVLVCGGPGSDHERPFAETMSELVERAGVPKSMIWTESRSHSTRQNAEFAATILKQRGIERIVLVTSAQDMLRAELCFLKQGIIVTPAPSSFKDPPEKVDDFIPGWKAIDRNERTLHETLGLAWYWLHGWI